MKTGAANIRIRPGRKQDRKYLERIAAAAYRQYIAVMGKRPAPMLADYGHHLAHDTVFVVLDQSQGAPLGYAVLILKKDGWWLENIAVDPRHAGRGIGTALLHHLEEYLAARTQRYQLYTNKLMARNIKWYLRSGFDETARRLEDGYERVFFAKRLGQRPPAGK